MEIRGSHGNGQCHWLNLPLLYISCSLCHPPQPLHCILSACLSTECLLLIIGWNTSGQAEPCQSAWPFCEIHKGVGVHPRLTETLLEFQKSTLVQFEAGWEKGLGGSR